MSAVTKRPMSECASRCVQQCMVLCALFACQSCASIPWLLAPKTCSSFPAESAGHDNMLTDAAPRHSGTHVKLCDVWSRCMGAWTCGCPRGRPLATGAYPPTRPSGAWRRTTAQLSHSCPPCTAPRPPQPPAPPSLTPSSPPPSRVGLARKALATHAPRGISSYASMVACLAIVPTHSLGCASLGWAFVG
jgi:hypothetical protein